MKRKLTIEKVLQKAKNVRFTEIPFYKEIIFEMPDDVDIDHSALASDVLAQLSQTHAGFLDTKIEDLLFEDERRKTRCLVRWSYIIGLLSTFGTLVTMIYLSVTTKTMPEGHLWMVLMIVPAAIMWTQSGVLKSENASSVSKIISGINPFNRNKKEKESSVRHYDDDDNGNPFR